MGYEINTPVKTVYLPIFDGSLTLAEYKEKTGIDLDDVFDFNHSDGESFLKPYTNVVLYAGESGNKFGTQCIYKGQMLSYFYKFEDPVATFHILTGIGESNAVISVLYVTVLTEGNVVRIILNER